MLDGAFNPGSTYMYYRFYNHLPAHYEFGFRLCLFNNEWVFSR